MDNATAIEPENIELEKKIEGSFTREQARVHVIANDGHVFLSGETKDFETKGAIEAMVWNRQGIRSVINHIRVDNLDDESYRLLEKRVLNCPFKGVDLLTS